MHQQPNRGTRPLGSGAKTSGFGDAFVSSSDAPQPQRTTRPLKMPAHMLKDAVPSRIADTKRDLDYVRHLTDLFRPHINVFRYAETLLTMPEDPEFAPPVPSIALEENEGNEENKGSEGSGENEGLADFEDFTAAPGPSPRELALAEFRLAPEKEELAKRIYERIRNDLKLRQRVQIAIHQYTEAEQNYQKALRSFGVIIKSSPENAWDLMDEMAIERLKGKAYAICGFYDNFKDDPVLGRVFPPPNQQAQKPRLNGGQQQTPQTRPLPQQRPQQPQQQQKPASGFLDNIKGLFGMK